LEADRFNSPLNFTQMGQISRTAEYMAFFRALEMCRPSHRRLISDSLAKSFLRPQLDRAVRLAGVPVLRWLIENYADRRLPGARTSAIARTRLIDKAWQRALGSGIRQIVVLGAGFDCRAYRLANSNLATVFEVDRPATQARKLETLKRTLPEVPGNVQFAAIDFERESLPEVLARNGFNSSLPALFIWEGVTNYLTDESVSTVLQYSGACAPGTQFVFTYVHRGVLDGSVPFYGGARIRRDVAALGEPWTFGFDPAELAGYLRSRNLVLEYDAGAREYREQVYGPRGAAMKGYEFYHLAIARVAEEPLRRK
jgi:methyltransferase (TIGR00027 family)